MMKKIIWRRWKDPLISTNDDADAEKPQILRHTPFGITTLKANSESEMFFNMWVGYTNFDITEEILEIIEDTDGVEILEYFSPYQFRISIGRAFNHKLVLKNIRSQLCHPEPKQYMFDKDVEDDIIRERMKLASTKEHWIMYVLPNGKFEVVTNTNEKVVHKQLEEFIRTRDSIGGILFTSVS